MKTAKWTLRPHTNNMLFNDFLEKLKTAEVDNAKGELCEIISFVSAIAYEEVRKAVLLKTVDTDDRIGLNKEKINKKVLNLVNERCEGNPVQYLTGRAYFYGREFFVDKRVLIPRFDTERVIDSIIGKLTETSEVLDLCCGSGCIGLTLALEKACKVTLADISDEALSVAKINAKKLFVENVKFLKADVLKDEFEGKFDLIISNPPYIPDEEMLTLSREVLKEPDMALRAGDGYVFYRRIPEKFYGLIKKNGFLVFETGYNQAEKVAELCKAAGYKKVTLFKDYSDINRAVVAFKQQE